MKIFLAACILFLFASGAIGDERGIASTFSDSRIACPPYRINPFKVIGVAHKTLPCGTLIEVTNRLNGRKSVFPIVDKGPCTTAHCQKTMPLRVRTRVLDLLPLAALRLGSTGLTPVTIRR